MIKMTGEFLMKRGIYGCCLIRDHLKGITNLRERADPQTGAALAAGLAKAALDLHSNSGCLGALKDRRAGARRNVYGFNQVGTIVEDRGEW